MRAVLYARVSGDDRGRGNLDSQIADCREYAQKQGHTVIAELREDERGVSGAIPIPPQIERALDMAQSKEFDVLIVRDCERFARGVGKQLSLEERFTDYGIRIEYKDETFDDSPAGKLMRTVKASIAEYNRTDIVLKMWRGRRWRVKQGRVMLHGSPAPYGYRAKEERDKFDNITTKWLEIYEPEAEIIRLIFRWYVEGDEAGKKLSISAIAKRLTEMGVPTWSDTHEKPPFPRKAGYGEWGNSTVAKILNNETYCGVWHYGKRGRSRDNPRDNWLAIERPEIAIISLETFEKAQERRKWNKKFYRKKTVAQYLMRGRVICGHCQSEMIARAEKKGKYTYYVCPKGQGRHKGETCENRYYFPSEDIDVQAWYELQAELYDSEILRRNLKNRKEHLAKVNAPIIGQLEVIDGLIEKHEKALQRTLSLYVNELIRREMLDSESAKQEGIIASLKEQKAKLEKDLNETGISNLSDTAIDWLCHVAETLCMNKWRAYDDVDFDEKRQFIESLNCRAILSYQDDERKAAFRFYLSPSLSIKPRTGEGWRD